MKIATGEVAEAVTQVGGHGPSECYDFIKDVAFPSRR